VFPRNTLAGVTWLSNTERGESVKMFEIANRKITKIVQFFSPTHPPIKSNLGKWQFQTYKLADLTISVSRKTTSSSWPDSASLEVSFEQL
jgi:hypothetical protein